MGTSKRMEEEPFCCCLGKKGPLSLASLHQILLLATAHLGDSYRNAPFKAEGTPSESKYLPPTFPIKLAFLVFSYSVASVTTFVISKAIYVDSRMFK